MTIDEDFEDDSSLEFDWNRGNLDHIARHGIDSEDVEEVFGDRDVVSETVESPLNEERGMVIGRTESGTLLAVIYTMRRGLVRVVTAHRASPGELRRYRRRNK